jgi:chromosome segregation ATPase
LDECEQKLSATKADLDKRTAENESLSNEREVSNKLLEECEALINTHEENNAALTTELAAVSEERDTLASEKEVLADQVKGLEEENTLLIREYFQEDEGSSFDEDNDGDDDLSYDYSVDVIEELQNAKSEIKRLKGLIAALVSNAT